MGTTLVGTALAAKRIITFDVGDSRRYLFSAGQLVQLSYGDVPEGESNRFGPRRSHALTQALGASSIPLTIESHVTVDAPLLHGETLLLCSDGLTGMVANEVISNTLKTAEDPVRSVRRLVAKAFSAGARDTSP